jgi:O-antigen ligase
MMPFLLGLLAWALATLWMEPRWPWAIFELGMFALAGWRLVGLRRWRDPAPMALLAGAVGWTVLQAAAGWTLSAARTSAAALTWAAFLATFAVSRQVFSEPARRLRAFRALSLFGLILAGVATLQQHSTTRVFWLFPSGFPNGVMGPFVNRNQYAAWVELLLPVVLYLAFADRPLRALHLVSAAVLFGSVVACASRAGFALAGLEIAAVFLVAALRRLAPRRALAAIALQFVLLAAAGSAAAGWSRLGQRLEEQGSTSLRAEALRATLQMIREHPATGYGIGVWPQVYPRYAAWDSGLFLNQAHNDWAQWAAEGGLPFFFLLLAFAALLSKRAVWSIYGIGTVVMLLHGLVDYPMQQRPALAAWFFALSGAAMAWRKSEAAAHDGLLRGTGSSTHRLHRGDPPRVSPIDPAAASGSIGG